MINELSKLGAGMINIAGIDKAKLLAALVNAAQPVGIGTLVALGSPASMSPAVAQEIIDKRLSHPKERNFDDRLYFDYVWGRPIKVDLSGDKLDPRLYDRDWGEGATAGIVAKLRNSA